MQTRTLARLSSIHSHLFATLSRTHSLTASLHTASMSALAASSAAPASCEHIRGFHPPLLRPTVDGTSDTLVRQVWRDLQGHSIEYRSYFSNHLAHGMIALHQLGASSERLEKFFPIASKHLEPLNPKPDESVGTITRENYLRLAGNGKGWANWLAFFRSQWVRIQQEQASKRTIGSANDSSSNEQALAVERALLNEFLPSLLPYIPGHATHPIIHLGLGQVLSDCDSPLWLRSAQATAFPAEAEHKSTEQPGHELVPIAPMNPLTIAGLSYLGYHGLRLDQAASYSPEAMANIPDANSLSLVQLLPRALAAFKPLVPVVEQKAKEEPYISMPIGDFQRRVLFVAQHASEALTAQDSCWRIDPSRTDEAAVELQHLALLLYGLSNNDFFLLHDCTSTFALRHLLPHLESPEDRISALRYALKTVLAVWAVQKLPAADSPHLAAAIAAGNLTAGVRSALEAEANAPKEGQSETLEGAAHDLVAIQWLTCLLVFALSLFEAGYLCAPRPF